MNSLSITEIDFHERQLPKWRPIVINVAAARTQSGRGPSGKLRNFSAMSAEKLAAVRDAVVRENNDAEALAVLVAS